MDIKIERCIDSLICDGYDLDDITLTFIKTLNVYQNNPTKINKPEISVTNINSLPKDVLVYMLLNSHIKDIISLCKSSKHVYEKVYMNETFWQKKIKLDFPDHKPYNFWSDTVKWGNPVHLLTNDHREAYILNYNLAKQCKYVFMRGDKKGERCPSTKANFQSSRNLKGGDEYCKHCLKKKTVKMYLSKHYPDQK